jgi:hypothetical protein
MPQSKCKHKDGWLKCYLHETLGHIAECRCGLYRRLNRMGTKWFIFVDKVSKRPTV